MDLRRFCTSGMHNAVLSLCDILPHFVGRVAQSVRVRDVIPVRKNSSAHPDGNWGPLYNWYGVCLGSLYLYLPLFIQF